MIQYDSCPICTSKRTSLIFEKKDRNFYRCRNCQFEFQSPMPDPKELSAYYEREYTDGLYKEFVDASYMKTVNATYRFEKTSPYISEKVLDVGCADGHFLIKLADHNISAVGIDISENAINLCTSKGLKAYNSSLEEFRSESKYNTIIGFDVIEHVLNPNEFIDTIKNLMSENGNLILSTPNKNSLHRRIMGKYWYFYIPEEHLLYFDKKTIKLLLEKHGFEVVKQARFSKPLTLEYGLIQFKQFNPFIYKILKIVTKLLPSKINNLPIPFYIGEMLTIAKLSEKL